jgi:hypothetical protein
MKFISGNLQQAASLQEQGKDSMAGKGQQSSKGQQQHILESTVSTQSQA